MAKKGEKRKLVGLVSEETGERIYYTSKKLKDTPVKITTIARGISFGGELEYADEMTLARSISNRMPIENYVGNNK